MNKTVTKGDKGCTVITEKTEAFVELKYLVNGIKRYSKDPHQEELPSIFGAERLIEVHKENLLKGEGR